MSKANKFYFVEIMKTLNSYRVLYSVVECTYIIVICKIIERTVHNYTHFTLIGNYPYIRSINQILKQYHIQNTQTK